MNVQTNEVTRHRMDRYRATLRASGFDEATGPGTSPMTLGLAQCLRAPTDAEAERRATAGGADGVPSGRAKRVYEEQGVLLKPETAPAARNVPQHSLLCGSPATVAEAISKIDAIGVGGLILAFRIGPMPGEVAEQSIRLFMQHVAPEFRSNVA